MRRSGIPSIKALLGASALALLAWGCDSGPSGPGELNALLQASATPLGGVILEVVGPGIESFSAAGGTKVLWAPTGAPDTYRVVAINEVAGDVRFQVSVLDLGADKPWALIVNLVDGNNLSIPATSAYEVAFAH